MVAESTTGSSSYVGSVISSRSSASKRLRPDNSPLDAHGEELVDKRSSIESGVFGVLFTLSKENSEARIRVRWVLLKIFLDTWQVFTTVISPAKQGWSINANGTAWAVVGVLNFTWLDNLGYNVYLAVLYTMVALLAINVGMCVWVAWCFKEQKFPAVWPIKALRLFSKVFFQAFDVACLNLLQLGVSCRFTGTSRPTSPRLHVELFPEYSCTSMPHIAHAIVSALCLILFVVIALLINMAEVEVNLLSRRPSALGHSGAEVMAFGIKVLLTFVNVFFGWQRVAACAYLALSLAHARQYFRWSPHLVAWMNYLKLGASSTIVWSSGVLVLLVFRPGVKEADKEKWAEVMTIVMIAGLAPAFACGALLSRIMIQRMTVMALTALANAKPDEPLEDICQNLDDPRDVEIVARCCRVWKDRYNLDPDAVEKARRVIQAGVAMFPNSAYMVLVHGNFMIDVLGVSQSGGRRIEDARKLDPGLMSRFIMFIRQQQATQSAAGNTTKRGAAGMDLLAYVEYQRKQRMVVRLHREALQAMCNFWKALDASRVSFMTLSKALAKIERSVSQAQAAYRAVLENYGNDSKLVRLYGRFLQTIKNDPWRASEYFAEADRLEELNAAEAGGPMLPDGTPLGRMDDLATAVLVTNAAGIIQVANRHAHILFGYNRGTLEAKPMFVLLAPHCSRRLADKIMSLATAVAGMDKEGGGIHKETVVGMRWDRLAFPVEISIQKASGVGEDSTFIAILQASPQAPDVACLWVASNGTIVACDPHFVSAFGWRSGEVNGASLTQLVSVQLPGVARAVDGTDAEKGLIQARRAQSASDVINRLLEGARSKADADNCSVKGALRCTVVHKYDSEPIACTMAIPVQEIMVAPVHEVRFRLLATDPPQLLVVNRKGAVLHASLELGAFLRDGAGGARTGPAAPGGVDGFSGSGPAAHTMQAVEAMTGELLANYSLSDFLSPPWKDMHIKFLKATSILTPAGRSPWSCRPEAMPGPTLELRTVNGSTAFMRVSVVTSEVGGELTHVIRLAKSSLESAVAERRVRLQLSEHGFIKSVGEGTSGNLLGFDPSQLVGHGIWEVLDRCQSPESGNTSSTGRQAFLDLVRRALERPGHNWRAMVLPPQRANPRAGGAADIFAAARTATAKAVVVQVHVEMPANDLATEDEVLEVYADLWPLTSVTGVLELDGFGRIRSVLEERLRPAGLMFGLPTQALVGTMLGDLVDLPPGRTRPGDLLTLHGAKKSSLKTGAQDANFKVGPLHVLHATHADGRPLTLGVQIVGKPGPGQPTHAILRFHASPLKPSALPQPDGAEPSAATAALAATTTTREANGLVTRKGKGGGVGSENALSREAARAGIAAELTTRPPVWRSPSTPDAAAAGGGTTTALAEEGSTLPSPISTSATAPGPTPAPATPITPGSIKVASGRRIPAPSTSINATATTPAAPPERLGSLGPVPTTSRTAEAGSLGLSSRAPNHVDDGDDYAVFILPHVTSTAVLPFAPAGAVLDSLGDGIPVPGVTSGSGKLVSALQAGRSKLAHLVRSARGGRQQGDSRLPSALAGDFPEAPPAPMDEGDVESVGKHSGSDLGQLKLTGGAQQRVMTWIASEGAYYQNSIKPAVKGDGVDDDDVRLSDDYPMPRGDTATQPSVDLKAVLRGGGRSDSGGVRRGDMNDPNTEAAGRPARPRESGPGVYPEEDAASEGGQSAMSAQSGGGEAEYKRGKRFRKLVKLMDSSQTQQVQRKFWINALGTVALLAAVHVVCFVLTVRAINSERRSMLQLSRSGQSQRYMHEISADVRSLDVIVKNRAIPSLYNASDEPFFVQRISRDADEVQVRLKEILQAHFSSSSQVKELFLYTSWPVWDGKGPNGTDKYTNVTIWDFAARFYVMAKQVEQNFDTWKRTNVSISDTPEAQFLLKSGPDLWRASRKVLDALLYEAVDNARWVDTLQLIFLTIEGTVVTSFAACYLAYLLRALAAQRYKLYGTFLLIPVGLSRALASQNTNLLLNGDEDEDDDDDDERAPSIGTAEENDYDVTAPSPSAKPKRRATLNVAPAAGGEADDDASTRSGGLEMRRMSSLKARPNRSITLESLDIYHGCWDRMTSTVKRLFSRRRGSVSPLPQSSKEGGFSDTKRRLKYDSHETIIIIMPFVLWSALVIALYAAAVVKLQGVVDVVAVHSVANFMSARTYRAVFFSQELVVEEDPTQLSARRSALLAVLKVVRDAWLTLQLGKDAYRAAGPNTERFPLVKKGLAHDAPAILDLFYSTGRCHRLATPCLGPDNRWYKLTHTSMDAMMEYFLMSLNALATNTSTTSPGLADEHFDYIYNVGSRDLLDGTVEIQAAHYDTIRSLFRGILVMHIILFLLFWIIFAGFFLLLLNPLLKQVSRERRHIADLMSQLPLELDVEKLVGRALGSVGSSAAAAGGTAGGYGTGGGGGNPAVLGRATTGGLDNRDGPDTTSKWKAIIRSVTQNKLQGAGGNVSQRGSYNGRGSLTYRGNSSGGRSGQLSRKQSR